MEAVTGYAKVETRNQGEIEAFVREHLGALEDHELSVRKTSDGQFMVEFYPSESPI
jgi:hypothetical protein